MLESRWARRVILSGLVAVPCVALAVGGPPVLGHALFTLGMRDTGAALMGNASWRGYTLAGRGDYLAAAAAFGSKPADSYNKGNALALAGRYGEALDAYDAALQADPEDEDARHNKAIVAEILDTEATPPGHDGGKANARATTEHHHGGSSDQQGDASSMGNGYTGNKEGASDATSQGSSKVSKMGSGQDQASGNDSEKASGSAGQAAGRGRSGEDMADAITRQLAINQRRYSRTFTTLNVKPTVEWLQTVTDDPGSWLKLQIRAEQKRRREAAARESGPGDD